MHQHNLNYIPQTLEAKAKVYDKMDLKSMMKKNKILNIQSSGQFNLIGICLKTLKNQLCGISHK